MFNVLLFLTFESFSYIEVSIVQKSSAYVMDTTHIRH